MKLPKNYVTVLTDWDDKNLSFTVLAYAIKNKEISKKPFLKGKVFFNEDPQGLRPYKFAQTGSKNFKFFKAEQFTQLLQKTSYILIPKTQKPWRVKEFKAYLKAYKISNYRIAYLCDSCLEKYSKFTLLTKKEVFYGFGKILCYNCAIEEIKSHIKHIGFKQSKSLLDLAKNKLLQTHNVMDALEAIEPYHSDDDLSKNEELTLFDVIKATPIEPTPIDKTILPLDIKNLLKRKGIKYLLPIQVQALKQGLLDGEDMMIIAGTSSGKTLIGEIAGINNLLNGKGKMLFLTPLVALTNQKYDYFLRKYASSGFKIGIRVGMTRLDIGEEDKIVIDTKIKDRNIVVGTVEAIDYLLRSGRHEEFGDVGTVVIDEFQLLGDAERGPELDGVIVRLKHLFPNIQFVVLSATIGNAEEVASHYGFKLLEQKERPVTLERHVILVPPEQSKIPIIAKLIRKDLKEGEKDKKLHQTIVFSPTRRGCELLAGKLNSMGIKTAYYHSGLPYIERRRIEHSFEKGDFQAIVTTAALGAGVDFSASQVIFESPAMGARWLTVAEFHQMMGRAGRFGKHDKGKVYLLLEPGAKIHSKQEETEEQVGIKLLTSKVEPLEADITFESEQNQVLAIISALNEVPATILKKLHQSMYYYTNPSKKLVEQLLKYRFVYAEKKEFKISELGKATSMSFIHPSIIARIIERLPNNDLLELMAELDPFDGIHLSSRIQSRVERMLKTRGSSKFFSSRVLDLMSGDYPITKEEMDPYVLDRLKIWSQLFYSCYHPEKPYCECGQKQAAILIMKLRIKGFSPSKIIQELEKNYDLTAYTGDIISFLDTAVRRAESIERIARVVGLKEVAKKAQQIKIQLQSPRKAKKKKISTRKNSNSKGKHTKK